MFNISVIIPSYNRADFLPRTLESVARQTFRPLEVVIVDDQSPDNTPDICAALIEKYKGQLDIVYTRHEKNKGEGGARNTGMRLARGNYMAFLDSDDEWLPQKLERQVSFLKETGANGVFCESFLVENERYDSAIHTKIDHDVIVPERLLTRGCGYGTGTNLLISRRAIADDIFDESMRLFIDLDWLYRVSQQSKLMIMHDGLSYYHKAPMRQGDYIRERVDIFMQKYQHVLEKWPWYKRRQVHACMDWYIAHAYEANKQNLQAARYFVGGILQWPVRRPGQYLHAVICFTRGMFG